MNLSDVKTAARSVLARSERLPAVQDSDESVTLAGFALAVLDWPGMDVMQLIRILRLINDYGKDHESACSEVPEDNPGCPRCVAATKLPEQCESLVTAVLQLRAALMAANIEPNGTVVMIGDVPIGMVARPRENAFHRPDGEMLEAEKQLLLRMLESCGRREREESARTVDASVASAASTVFEGTD